MKSKKALILIHDSPLQVINSLEAVYSLGLDPLNCDWVCFLTSNSNSQKQVKEVADYFNLNTQTFTFNQNPYSKINRFYKLKSFLKTKKVDYILVSMLNVDLNVYAANLKKNAEVIFYDEGTHTLDLAQLKRMVLTPKSGPAGFIKKALFRLRPTNLDKLFTVFHKQLAHLPIDITPNNYSYIREHIQFKDKSNQVYIVGQHLYKKEVHTSTFLDYLSNLKNKFSENKLYYIPHRHDSTEILEQIHLTGINIRHIQTCIELELLMKPMLPLQIIGFSSSALLNLKLIFGENIQVTTIRIDTRDIKKAYQDKMNQIYTTFSEYGIKEIDL